ncbi:MAG: AAA family ATPase [Candidatus Micrarchaeota archaeon]
MKGPNPFALWEDDPSAICGRKDESRIFMSFANGASSNQAGVMLVVGGPGEGKSAMLRYFRSEAEKAGMLAPYVNAEKGENEADIADKLYQEIISSGAKPAHAAPDGFSGLAEFAGKAAKKGFGAALLIDDLDNMKKADEALDGILRLLKASWGKRNVSFIVSSTREFRAGSDLLTLVRLKPFGEHDAREMMEKALKKGPPKMGEECLQSVLADTGGNPKLMKRVCHEIYERLRENEKVITKGHYLAYLPQIMGALSREWFGRLYQETPGAERAILQVMAKSEEGMHVSDIAKKLGKPLGPVTALTKRLLERGQVVKLDRGKYRVFSKLYAKYVSQRG